MSTITLAFTRTPVTVQLAGSVGTVLSAAVAAALNAATNPGAGNAFATVSDVAASHAASAITNTPAGNIAATNVQAALNELDTEKAATGHTHSYAASAIANTPAGNIAATDVQAALNELDSEKSDTAHTHAAHFGDVANYAEFSAVGQLTLAGTARVRKHVAIPLDGLGSGGSAPTITRLGNTYGWAFTIGDDGYASFEVPPDWDPTTDIDLTMHIYTNEAYATRSGEVRFQIGWSAIAVNANEAVDSPVHSGTAIGADLNIAATAKGMQEYVAGPIVAASLGVNDSVSLKVQRIALSAGVNPVAEPVVIFMEYSYIANHLGYAT